MLKNILVIGFLSAFMAFPVLAETELNGELETSLSAGLEKGEIYRRNLRFDLNLESAMNDTEIKMDLRGQDDSIKIINQRSLEVREAWMNRSFLFNGPVNDITVKAGKIIHTWGNADEFKPCDILNPQDLSYLLFKPIQERKISVFSGVVSTHIANRLFLEFTAIPFFKPSEYTNSKVFMPSQFAELTSNPVVTLTAEELPSDTLIHSSIGFRMGITFLGVDAHFNYFNGFDNLPTLQTFFSLAATFPFYALTVKPVYNEIILYGLDLQRSLFSGISTRLELAWFDKGKEFSYSQESANPMTSPYFIDISSGGTGNSQHGYGEYTLGLDVTQFFIRGLYLNIQMNQKIISEWTPKLAQEEISTSILGTLEYSFWNQNITFKARGFYSIDEKAYACGFEAGVNLSGNLQLDSGIWIMEGPVHSYYGQFKDNDMVFASMTASY